MIKLLRLSPYCYPEQVSSSHLSRDLNKALIDDDIMSVFYAPTPSRGITKDVRDKYKKIKYEERNDGKTVIHRFRMFPEQRNPIQRAIRYVLVNLKQLHYGVKEDNIDLIYSASTPPTQGVLCGNVKKRLSKRYGRRVPYLYCLQDVFPDSLVNSNMTKKGSLIWKIGRKIEDYTYRSADKIIVISNDIKRNIMEKGVPEEKIEVIPNWIDAEAVTPVPRDKNKLFDDLGLCKDCFYVTYAGNLGKAQSIDTILDAAEILKDKTDIQFVIFGGGTGKEEAERRISTLSNVRLFPLMPQERVPEVYSLGDVSIVACKSGFGKGAIPSKTFSIMATATPIMLSFDKGSELWNIIEENNCGFLCDADNPTDLAREIEYAQEHPEVIRAKGERSRALVEQEYSKESGTKAYLSVIHSLVYEVES